MNLNEPIQPIPETEAARPGGWLDVIDSNGNTLMVNMALAVFVGRSSVPGHAAIVFPGNTTLGVKSPTFEALRAYLRAKGPIIELPSPGKPHTRLA